MKKTITLHLGHGKTGSSYLQSCLALNKDKLLEFNTEYPWHISIPNAAAGHISSGNGKQFLEILSNLNTRSKKIVFSNEKLFSTLLQSTEFEELLKKKEYDFEVIFFTRNLFEWKFSTWGQLVKRKGLTLDVNSHFFHSPRGPYHKCLKWVKLAEQFQFKLLIRNYSRHKKDLAQQFFSDLTETQDFPLTLPKTKEINRSLTIAELNMQRVINSFDPNGHKLSNQLIKELPSITTLKTKCNREAYEFVLSTNLNAAERLNRCLDSNEIVSIESPEDVTCSDDESNSHALGQKQIEIIANYLSKKSDKKMPQ